MTVSLGRIAITAPSSIQRSGSDALTLALDTNQSATAAAGLIAMKQLKNMAAYEWEQFIPFIHTDASMAHIVQIGRVDVRDHAQSLVGGSYDLAMSLAMVRHARNARLAVLNNCVDRSGAGTPLPWTGVPASATAIDTPGFTTGFTSRSGPTVEGYPTGVNVFTDAAVAGASVSYQLDASDWYDAAAWVYDARFDETQSIVVGEQWDWPLTSSALHFGITNGLVRVETGDNSGGLDNAIRTTMPAASPTSWSSVHQNWGIYVEYPVGSATYNNVGKAPSSVSVNRNSPQEVSVRLAFDVRAVANQPIRVNVDLTLRRGGRMVDLICSSPSGSYKYRIKPPGATAFSIAGAHYIQTANDADGNQAAGWTHNNRTAGSPGQMQSAAAGTFSTFAVGGVYGGTGAAGAETATSLDNQFDSVGSETIRMVAP